MQNPEISKVLTLSTGHITRATNQMLFEEVLDLVVYALDGFGYLIYTGYSGDHAIPEDLKACIAFALKHDCEWLLLD